MHKLTIRHARFSGDLAAIAALIQEYIETIDRSACKEEVEAALDGLPAPYDREDSGYFLAESGESIAGGVAFSRLGTGEAEMARLFVRPEYRRHGIARSLVERAMKEARALGYERMVLHTLPEWRAAQALYSELAFTPSPTIAVSRWTKLFVTPASSAATLKALPRPDPNRR